MHPSATMRSPAALPSLRALETEIIPRIKWGHKCGARPPAPPSTGLMKDEDRPQNEGAPAILPITAISFGKPKCMRCEFPNHF